MSTITIHHLSKAFGPRNALDDVSLEIRSGEMVGLIGASGSGKSTLLRHISGLTLGERGTVEIDGRAVQRDGRLTRGIRDLRSRAGFVFQQFNLVSRLPLITNVMTGLLHRVPLWRSLLGHFTREEIRIGMEALHRVGMLEYAWQRASTLSGGQQQRGAIARTLVQRAHTILADEPIASLDPESSRRVMEILAAINREDGCTVVVSLHQVEFARQFCPRIVALHKGKVVYDGPSALLSNEKLADMQKRTGLKINAFFASDYAGIIEAMRFNKVQVAWYGNKSAMEAVDRASGEVFAQMIAPDGSQGYYSLLVVHKDSPIRTLDDVIKNGKNYSFGNGDPNSTSGFLVPSYYVFALNKIDAKTHFKTVRGASHETNLLAVVNKQIDVATNNTENLERFTNKFPDKAAEVRVVWKSPLIPSDPLVWRKDLVPELKKKVRDFILTYGTGANGAHEKEIMLKLTTAGFKASDDRQLIPIRQLELFKDKTKIENDTTMSAADKTAKLDDINRKLAQLNTQMAAK